MRGAITLGLALALASDIGYANGRFPAAQHVVVGPGAGASSIVVRTTFGLFVSRDEGRSFSWICEEAMGYQGGWDPSVEMSADGALLLGVPDGTLRASDDCSFGRPSGGGADAVVDLASSSDGERVVAITSGFGAPARVLVSGDRGRSFVAHDPGVGDIGLTTIDFAPSRPDTLWMLGRRGDPQHAVLLRSDDGGSRFAVASEPLADAPVGYLSAVDASDAQKVWVRVPRDETTDLLRTDDGGRSWHLALTLQGRMSGFALAADGMRVWAGGPSSGLWRSVDGGGRFERIESFPVLCLRHHAGALYVCTDQAIDGVALVRVRDGASASEPLLVYRDAEGTPDCPGSSPVTSMCAPLWRSQRELLIRSVGGDGGAALNAGIDGGVTDAGMRPVTVSDDCGCHAASGARGGAWWLVVLGCALARRARRR